MSNTPKAPAQRHKLIRRLALSAVAAVALAGGWFAYAAATAEDPAADVTTAVVKTGDVQNTVLATGLLKPARLVAVGAQVSGRVTALKVALGDVVKQGDLIAEIDSQTRQNDLRTSQAALANVRAQLAEKRATLKQAELDLARQKKMLAQNAVSQADFEAAEATADTTRAQIDALNAQIVEAEVAVETAGVNLGYTKITAPIDGTVLAVVTQEGQTVNATQSAPTIVVLGQIDVMTVRAEISEADVVNVRPGQAVYFNILGEPDHRYEASLGSIEPAPESITSDSSITSSSASSSSSSASTEAIYYIGTFDVPNPDGKLRTYMTAEVQIVLGEARGVLTIPAAALGGKAGGDAYSVRVLGSNGQIESREVEIGLNNKVTAEVKVGLAEGERVVVGGARAAAAGGGAGRRGLFGF
ncbi:efflux RND transporter periplasmic adaptor subunit [Pelagibius sp. 7325]|uniref:efflux RND transporter periplasmic adaptor subunit n=1 Tax=Pelagibius sp. 7325 TaxID=3131994 RepID=UPI0030EED3AC